MHLEGARLTMEQSQRVLGSQVVPEADRDDARELLNYSEALRFASAELDNGEPLTEGLIRDLHKRLVNGSVRGDGAPGEYRRVDGYVIKAGTREVVYQPPAAADVPVLVAELVAWLNAETAAHPVLVAGVAQLQLAHIHPFLHGNGRAARVLATVVLSRSGYGLKGLVPISEHHDRNRPALSRALQGVRHSGMDLTGWLEFFAEGLATQLDRLKSQMDREIQRAVVARHGLTERQAAAVGRVLGEGRLTIEDFQRLCPGAPRRALQRELKHLADKGLLRRAGPANRPQYLAGSELE